MAFRARHLLGIEHLAPLEITTVLDLADRYVDLNRRTVKQSDVLAGMTQINLFFENSTRTQSSFELAGKRLGADVMNMSVANSSVKKGETLIDTAMTLNAMHPDLLVVRHGASGAVNLLAQKVDCAVLNAGDGRHEHPTQALLDALTIRRAKGRIQRLTIAIEYFFRMFDEVRQQKSADRMCVGSCFFRKIRSGEQAVLNAAPIRESRHEGGPPSAR